MDWKEFVSGQPSRQIDWRPVARQMAADVVLKAVALVEFDRLTGKSTDATKGHP